MIRLRVPGTLRYRDLSVRVVAAACKLVGRDGDDEKPAARPDHVFVSHVISAFGEAFNNAAIHSYTPGHGGDVEVQIEVDPDRITIRLLDFGSSFDPSDVPQPDLEAMPESGLGVYIIKSFMDEVSYQKGSPNVLTMTKYVSPSGRLLDKPLD